MTYNLELLLSLCSCLHSESQSAACSISEPSWNGGAAELSSTGLMQDQLLNCTKSQKVIFREQILNLWVLKLAERNSLYYTAAIFLSDMKRLFVPWQSFSRNKARRHRDLHMCEGTTDFGLNRSYICSHPLMKRRIRKEFYL